MKENRNLIIMGIFIIMCIGLINTLIILYKHYTEVQTKINILEQSMKVNNQDVMRIHMYGNKYSSEPIDTLNLQIIFDR